MCSCNSNSLDTIALPGLFGVDVPLIVFFPWLRSEPPIVGESVEGTGNLIGVEGRVCEFNNAKLIKLIFLRL